MYDLWNTFVGYIRINCDRIPWIILFSFVFYIVFELLGRYPLVEFKYNTRKKWLLQGALSVTCAVIFVLSLFGREQADYGMSLIPLESYMDAFRNNSPELMLQNLMNVVVYIPGGLLLPCCFKSFETWKRVLLTVVICSVGIELIQALARVGYPEVDDVLNNVLGAVIGKGLRDKLHR